MHIEQMHTSINPMLSPKCVQKVDKCKPVSRVDEHRELRVGGRSVEEGVECEGGAKPDAESGGSARSFGPSDGGGCGAGGHYLVFGWGSGVYGGVRGVDAGGVCMVL